MPYQCSPRYARRAAFAPFGGLDVLNGLVSAFDEKPTRCPASTTSRPHFDVYETKDSYVLEGELPGVSDKKSINLQFTDSQTLSIKGVIGRPPRDEEKEEYTSRQSEKKEAVDTEMSDDTAATTATLDNESPVEGLVRKGSPAPSYHATVEDGEDEDDNTSGFEVVNTPRTNTPAPAVPGGPAADEKPKEESAPAPAKRSCGNGRKYWVTERSRGAFHRSFNFSGLVDQDNVKAHLENGLLTIVIPKRKPSVTRVQIE